MTSKQYFENIVGNFNYNQFLYAGRVKKAFNRPRKPIG
jgi:hypothetical protein